MVNLKIRKGQIGKLDVNIDFQMEGNALDIFATSIELEQAVFEILKDIEQVSGINVHEAFLENIAERFKE